MAPERGITRLNEGQNPLRTTHHPLLRLAPMSIGGKFNWGVVAQRDWIPPNNRLVRWDGLIYRRVWNDFDLPETDICGRPLRGYPLLLDPTNGVVVDSWSLARSFNHMCGNPLKGTGPNTGIRIFPDGIWLVSLTWIPPGEECRWDYGTYQPDSFCLFPPGSLCDCMSPDCRSAQIGIESLPAEIRMAYYALGILAPWGTPKLFHGAEKGRAYAFAVGKGSG